jgi:hypothetical protein
VSPAGHTALATCHAELRRCLASSPSDPSTCATSAHQCVHDALVADFTQLCALVQSQCAQCSSSAACSEASARCAAGIPFGDLPAAAGK